MESVGNFGKLGKFTIFIPVDSAFKVKYLSEIFLFYVFSTLESAKFAS